MTGRRAALAQRDPQGYNRLRSKRRRPMRKASIARKTAETDITVELNLDGTGA